MSDPQKRGLVKTASAKAGSVGMRFLFRFSLWTAVIGGIYEEVITNDTTKVPFLGDVPVVGWLFKNTGRSSQKTELLIFLTPRVVRDTVTSVR